ncbi:MAG: methionine--tRNA ligase subunit beta, partial [Nonlabens sp.]|nr:methionine--tRNA ligase subunit beta [Nonlabens sp.]
NELVAILGNFINRALVLTHKYYEGIVPAPGTFTERDLETLAAVKTYPQLLADSLDRYRFRESANEYLNLARLGNKYLADEEPWKLIKTDPERVKTVMYVGLQIAAALAILGEPFLPHTSKKLTAMLGQEQSKPTWNTVEQTQELLPAGHKINEAQLLFSRIEDEQIQAQLEKLEATKAANKATNPTLMAQKEETNYDDFMKMDLRVGEILTAEKMPKADKLMVMTVDTGIDKRTIVSGIAQHFTAEELVGRKVTVLANLAPRMLRGVESQGMILLAEHDGKLVFVNPDDAVVNGATIA